MSQSPPFQPSNGFPVQSQTDLLRLLLWNTWYLAGAGGGIPSFVPVPASSSAAGTAGQMAYDGSYLYIAVANATWRRVAIDDWA